MRMIYPAKFAFQMTHLGQFLLSQLLTSITRTSSQQNNEFMAKNTDQSTKFIY